MTKKMKGTWITIWLMWSNTTFANPLFIPGDFIIGGILPIHKMNATKGGHGTCTKEIQYEYGIQPLEAMIFIVKELNRQKFLGNVTLGLWVYDSCENPHYALQRSLNFFKVFTSQMYSDLTCHHNSNKYDKTIGVVGAHSIPETVQIAGTMSMLSVPLVSYMATSSFLSNKKLYPHFFRTIPNDEYIGIAIMKILDQLKWNYVSVVYSSTPYGIQKYQSLIRAKTNYTNICFGPSHMITDNFHEEDYDRLMEKLYDHKHPRVVVMFAEKYTMEDILSSVNRQKETRPFTWIIGEFVIHTIPSKRVILALLNALEGAIFLQPESIKLPGFDDYFKALMDHPKNTENHWFPEFVNQYLECVEGNCTGGLKNSFHNDIQVTKNTFRQNNYLNYIRDAVYALAHATRNAINSSCMNTTSPMCYQKIIAERAILRHLKNVAFDDLNQRMFRFDDGGNGPIRYIISNIQKPINPNKIYKKAILGYYNASGPGSFQLEASEMKFRFLENGSWEEFPTVPCSCEPMCERHQIISPIDKDSSCGRCVDCNEHSMIVHGECEKCNEGWKPTSNRSSCVPIPETYVEYSESGSIIAIAVSVSGIILTIFVCVIYALYHDTILIKVCGRESLVSLSGIMISFLMTFIIFLEPSRVSCTAIRLGIGVSHTVCYTAIVSKIIRMHRMVNDHGNQKKLRYTSPRSQVIIPGILTLIEVWVIVIWIIIIPPESAHLYPSKDINLKICASLNDSSFLIALLYPSALIIISTIYVIKTRKYARGFIEITHIGFTNYATIVLWLAFLPLYLLWHEYSKRVFTLALWLALNGWIELWLLFFPKLYIILLRPEKNTEEFLLAMIGSNFLHALNGSTIVDENTSEDEPLERD